MKTFNFSQMTVLAKTLKPNQNQNQKMFKNDNIYMENEFSAEKEAHFKMFKCVLVRLNLSTRLT